MKKIFVLFLVVFSLGGCNSKNKIEFFCNDEGNDMIYYFYEDDVYKYSYSNTGYYINYNGKKIMFAEALDQKIISLDDIDEIIKKQGDCQYSKTLK